MYRVKKLHRLIIVMLILFGVVISFFLLKVRHKHIDKPSCYPQIILKGNRIISMFVGENYQEPGYELRDSCGENLEDRIEIQSDLKVDSPSTYEIIYKVSNQYGNFAQERRFVTVKDIFDILYQDAYDEIDNEVRGWGVPSKKDGSRPVEAGNVRENLLQYNAYLIDDDENKLYLTFDEGSNDTYLEQIVDVLNENDVKATFFFCRRYILDHPSLMKKLVATGHSVGNHTANHYQMPQYATREGFQNYLNEIKAVEEAFQQVTGHSMDRIYREPKGEYSYRSLQIMKDLGYKTYFWSVAYLDYADDVSKESAFQELTSRVHNGAIYLIHPKNKGNYEAMDDFIKSMKQRGYTFDLVKNIE